LSPLHHSVLGKAHIKLQDSVFGVDHDFSAFSDARVIGYGTTSSGGSISDNLLQADVELINSNDCNANFGYNNEIEAGMLCGSKSGVDSCQGDSGGPLFLPGTEPVQVGIVSWGYGCADISFPGVYASVGYHLEWIHSTIAEPPAPGEYVDDDGNIDDYFGYNTYGSSNSSASGRSPDSGCDASHTDLIVGNDGCCTPENQCGQDEGDCDTDGDCKEGWGCGTDNCAWGDWDDCCIREDCSNDLSSADSYGDDCNSYTAETVSWCGNYDTEDFHAMGMCCVCGGGASDINLYAKCACTTEDIACENGGLVAGGAGDCTCNCTGTHFHGPTCDIPDTCTEIRHRGNRFVGEMKHPAYCGWWDQEPDSIFRSSSTAPPSTFDPPLTLIICENNLQFTDTAGDNCADYTEDVSYWCGEYDTKEFDSMTMCCVCINLAA
jgi:hypothetical protein